MKTQVMDYLCFFIGFFMNIIDKFIYVDYRKCGGKTGLNQKSIE